jgi:hypothetical protein
VLNLTGSSSELELERLELYINLLRQIAINPDEYRLWDWIIVNRLNTQQHNDLMDILKKYVRMDISEQQFSIEDLQNEIFTAINTENNSFNQDSVVEILNCASCMPPFNRFKKHLNRPV